jgi:hypothetical protein
MLNTKKLLAALSATALVATFGSSLSTNAAGIGIGLTASSNAVSSATTLTLALTPSAAISIGDTIQVVRPTAAYTGTSTLAVSAGAIGGTTETVLGSETISTATVTTAIPAAAFNITLSGLTTAATPSNNAIKVYAGVDYGANFHYVGDANVVNVRARVPLQLSFVIRNNADTADTNICDMGDLTTSAVGNCEYRLKVSTNATNGYTVNVVTSGDFTNGTANFVNAAAGTAGTGGTAQAAGTEMYGAIVTKGSITGAGGTTTLGAAYDAGATNNVSYVNTTVASLMIANKPNAPLATDLTNTTLVRHEAGISASTAAGLYNQQVTYTVTPSF